MRNKLKLLVLALSLCLSTVFATPAINLSILKNQIIDYHQSGAYEAAMSRVGDKAERYLQKRVNENNKSVHPKKLALVFDIDETSLSSYAALKRLNFGGTNAEIDAVYRRTDAPAIEPTLKLYRYAVQHGVSVFFITGRRERDRSGTEKNLKAAGYTKWAHVYLKPNDYRLRSAIPFKSSRRKLIVDRGYDVVVNMGDQYSDLKGGYSDATFKYPNYIYFIP